MQAPVCPQEDPFNAASVKLAEATRIRLFLPGLSATSTQDDREDNSKGSSDAARRAARKLAKAARYTQVSQDAIGAAASTPQVFVENLADDSDEALSVGEQQQNQGGAATSKQGTAGARTAGVHAAAACGIKKASCNADGRSSGGGSHRQGSSRPQSQADAAAGYVVPVWERLATPSTCVARDKPLSASSAADVVRSKKAVVAKTFTIGMTSPGGLFKPDNAAVAPSTKSADSTATAGHHAPAVVIAGRGLEGRPLRKHSPAAAPAGQSPAIVMPVRSHLAQGNALHVLQQLAHARCTEQHPAPAHVAALQQPHAESGRPASMRLESAAHVKVVDSSAVKGARVTAGLVPAAASSLALLPTRAHTNPARTGSIATGRVAPTGMGARSNSSTGVTGAGSSEQNVASRPGSHASGDVMRKGSHGPPASFVAGPRVQAGASSTGARPGVSRLYPAHDR